jgi:hypothetical protein
MRTRLSAGENPNRKRMACLVTVYDAGPAERRPHDVTAPPGGQHGARTPRPGPKALAKWLVQGSAEDAVWTLAVSGPGAILPLPTWAGAVARRG